MNKLRTQFVVICSLLLLATVVDARLYRWVDSNGKVHYSDQLPPAQSKQGHQVLSDQGQKLKEVAPEKTREQLLDERRERSRIEEENERIRLVKERDDMLLRTFTTVEDLDRVINDRIAVLDSIITVTSTKLIKLNSLLKDTEKRKIWHIKEGREVPRQVKKNIIEYRQQIRNNESLILRNQRRKQLIAQKFEIDRERFLDLMEQRRLNRELAREF